MAAKSRKEKNRKTEKKIRRLVLQKTGWRIFLYFFLYIKNSANTAFLMKERIKLQMSLWDGHEESEKVRESMSRGLLKQKRERLSKSQNGKENKRKRKKLFKNLNEKKEYQKYYSCVIISGSSENNSKDSSASAGGEINCKQKRTRMQSLICMERG